MLDFDKFPSLFSLSLFKICHRHVNSDFALAWGAVGVGHLCPPFFGILTQHVPGVGIQSVLLT